VRSATFAAVERPLTCSRVDCAEPAVAVVAFEARECLVWLDPITAPGRGAALLCESHADRLSPPRGWNLLDRRAAESRLWTGRAVVPSSWMSPRRPRPARTARPRSCAPAGSPLPFAENAVDASDPDTEPVVAPPWSPRNQPGPEFDRLLDARTPLLARAFESARPPDDV